MLADFIAGAPDLREVKISDFNSFDGVAFSPSAQTAIDAFIGRLVARGIGVYRFRADSDDQVLASCGQMRAKLDKYI